MDLGRLGVWSWIDHLPPDELAAFAGRLETWGYSALWIPEAIGRNPFATHGFLAGRTRSLLLATGNKSELATGYCFRTVTVESGGAVAPGTDPGVLTTGDVDFMNGSNFDVEFGVTSPGNAPTDPDQVVVAGTVSA